MSIDVVDIEGAMRVYLNGYPGLVGAGNPVTNGVHIAAVRSPSRGVIVQQTLITPRTTDDTTDDARLTYQVRAVGSEQGAREVAELAARRLATALHALDGNGVTVTTRRGDHIKLIVAGSVAGPTFAGDLGGEVQYRVDVSVRAQPG
jgi:hypothetical protein